MHQSMDHKYDVHHTRWADFETGPLQEVSTSDMHPNYFVKRLDLLQSWVNGNKYYKLKYVLKNVLHQNKKTVISKGGMFSNHLAALSKACDAFDLNLIAMVRSYQPDEENPSIRFLKNNNHEVRYLKPEDYKLFGGEQAEAIDAEAVFVPEGGASTDGVKGAAELTDEITGFQPSHIILAGGTMSTAAGVASTIPSGVKLIVVPAWKGCKDEYFRDILSRFQIPDLGNWEIWPMYHFGGFARYNQTLVDFIADYYRRTNIPLDPVYTGKLLYGVEDKINSGIFSVSDRIVVIHSGGHQGMRGFRYRYPEDWSEVADQVYSEGLI